MPSDRLLGQEQVAWRHLAGDRQPSRLRLRHELEPRAVVTWAMWSRAPVASQSAMLRAIALDFGGDRLPRKAQALADAPLVHDAAVVQLGLVAVLGDGMPSAARQCHRVPHQAAVRDRVAVVAERDAAAAASSASPSPSTATIPSLNAGGAMNEGRVSERLGRPASQSQPKSPPSPATSPFAKPPARATFISPISTSDVASKLGESPAEGASHHLREVTPSHLFLAN